MDQHPHSTLKPDMSCPLEGGGGREEARGEKRKERREDDESEEEEEIETKREKIEENSVEIIEQEPKSPATLNRERVMSEAKLLLESEKAKALTAQQNRIMALLDSDSGDSGKLANVTSLVEDSTVNESRSLLIDSN